MSGKRDESSKTPAQNVIDVQAVAKKNAEEIALVKSWRNNPNRTYFVDDNDKLLAETIADHTKKAFEAGRIAGLEEGIDLANAAIDSTQHTKLHTGLVELVRNSLIKARGGEK